MSKTIKNPGGEQLCEPIKIQKIDASVAKRRRDVKRIYMLEGICNSNQTANLMKELKIFLNDGGNVGQTYRKDQTLLHQFARSYDSKKQKENVLETLLLWGADPNARSEKLGSPIHEAVNSGRCDNVKLLLDFGADANAVGPNGLSPLAMAIENFKKSLLPANPKIVWCLLVHEGNYVHPESKIMDALKNINLPELWKVFWMWGDMLEGMELERSDYLLHIPYNRDLEESREWGDMRLGVASMKRVHIQKNMRLMDLAKMTQNEACKAARKYEAVRNFMENEWPLIQGQFDLGADMVNKNVQAAMGRIRLFEGAMEAFQQLSNGIVIELALVEIILKKLAPADLRRLILSVETVE